MENMFSLKGKVIIVTGGTGILGHAFVLALAAAGATVGVLGRNQAKAEERVKEITDAGGEAMVLIADVQDEAQLIECRKKYWINTEKLMDLSTEPGEMYPKVFSNPVMTFFP